MRIRIIKYTLLVVTTIALILIYLSVIGVETEKFNKQIKDKFTQKNSKLDIKLKKIKLTLDPINFKINAKTVGAKIIYQTKIIELEYIKTQISLNSLIQNKFISSNIRISSRSILLKDFVNFARIVNSRPELFFLERLIKKGYVIFDIELNINENGDINDDYQVNAILKDGKIDFLKNYNFDRINFALDIKKNIFNFKDIDFSANNIKFFSRILKVQKNKKDFLFDGVIENKNSILDDKLLNLFESKFENLNFKNISFSSRNNFFF